MTPVESIFQNTMGCMCNNEFQREYQFLLFREFTYMQLSDTQTDTNTHTYTLFLCSVLKGRTSLLSKHESHAMTITTQEPFTIAVVIIFFSLGTHFLK